MKKSIVIAIVGVLVVAGVGSAVYFQTTKKPSVGSVVVAIEQMCNLRKQKGGL